MSRSQKSLLPAPRSALGKRLRVFEELRDALARAVCETRNQWLATFSLELLTHHDRPRVAELIPALIGEDPSWGIEPVVSSYLHRRRQDLITPFLGQRDLLLGAGMLTSA